VAVGGGWQKWCGVSGCGGGAWRRGREGERVGLARGAGVGGCGGPVGPVGVEGLHGGVGGGTSGFARMEVRRGGGASEGAQRGWGRGVGGDGGGEMDVAA